MGPRRLHVIVACLRGGTWDINLYQEDPAIWWRLWRGVYLQQKALREQRAEWRRRRMRRERRHQFMQLRKAWSLLQDATEVLLRLQRREVRLRKASLRKAG